MAEYYLPRISYTTAYRVLPRFAFKAFEKADEMWKKNQMSAGPSFYWMSCGEMKLQPMVEDARTYIAESGPLTNDYFVYLLTYPVPPPIDFHDPGLTPERRILAPHFSAIIRHLTSGEVHYFVLGQAPHGGLTTLRCVTVEHANCNLGPGPVAEKVAFLATVKNWLLNPKRPILAVTKPGPR
jgi:hypothetical protein